MVENKGDILEYNFLNICPSLVDFLREALKQIFIINEDSIVISYYTHSVMMIHFS